ncbi:MAG: class I SAM-dependent methyltransferase [Chloroflexota bacterium]
MESEPQKWHFHNVVDVDGPAHIIRAYLEQRDLRAILRLCLDERPVSAACDIGSGYGRMSQVLSEFAAQVVGFERQREILQEAKKLIPAVQFKPIENITTLPVGDNSFELALTFTVLQHISDSEVQLVAKEIQRLLAPGGTLVICEETDPGHHEGEFEKLDGMFTIGRTTKMYQDIFSPMQLIHTQKRIIEPGYPRPDVGTYMVFQIDN